MRKKVATKLVTAEELQRWVNGVDPRATLSYLIEDEVVELRAATDTTTFGYFCLASGANSVEVKTKEDVG